MHFEIFRELLRISSGEIAVRIRRRRAGGELGETCLFERSAAEEFDLAFHHQWRWAKLGFLRGKVNASRFCEIMLVATHGQQSRRGLSSGNGGMSDFTPFGRAMSPDQFSPTGLS